MTKFYVVFTHKLLYINAGKNGVKMKGEKKLETKNSGKAERQNSRNIRNSFC